MKAEPRNELHLLIFSMLTIFAASFSLLFHFSFANKVASNSVSGQIETVTVKTRPKYDSTGPGFWTTVYVYDCQIAVKNPIGESQLIHGVSESRQNVGDSVTGIVLYASSDNEHPTFEFRTYNEYFNFNLTMYFGIACLLLAGYAWLIFDCRKLRLLQDPKVNLCH